MREEIGLMPHPEFGDRGAGSRIDGDDLGRQPAIRRRTGEEPRRVARSDLDDAPGLAAPNHGVGRGRVEPWEPVLVEPSQTRPVADTLQVGPELLDLGEYRLEGRLGGAEQ